MANSCSRQLEDERNRRVAVVEAFNIADQSTQDLRNKLNEKECGFSPRKRSKASRRPKDTLSQGQGPIGCCQRID